MKYKFKNDDIVCYTIPVLGSTLTQLLWFIKWGEPRHNFHRYGAWERTLDYGFWKLSVVKSKVVLGLYK